MKPLLYYSVFQLCLISIYVALMSVISFFHFLLDHKFALIESWTHRNGWEIIGIAKLLSLFIVFKFLEVKFPTKSYLQNYFFKNFQAPKWEVLAFIVFTLCYFSYSGIPQVNQASFKLTFTILSFLGLFVFYAADFILIYVIAHAFPERRIFRKMLNLVIGAFLFYEVGKILMPFSASGNYLTVFHFMNIMLLFEIYQDKWTNPLLYILLLVCPMGAFLGLDPVWQDDYSLFKFSTPLDFSIILILWCLSIYYLYYKKRVQLTSETE